ncbi:hypothetical protein ACE0DR_29005 [Azotobacter sp. CWF10]
MNISLTPGNGTARIPAHPPPLQEPAMPVLNDPHRPVFNALLDPLGQRTAQRRTRRHEDPQAVAQDSPAVHAQRLRRASRAEPPQLARSMPGLCLRTDHPRCRLAAR